MTCREKLIAMYPGIEHYIENFCPDDFEIASPYSNCSDLEIETRPEICKACWDREIPEDGAEPDKQHILDSGDRTEFESGAVRDMRVGKGRCDLMPLDVVSELFENRTKARDAFLSHIYDFQTSGAYTHLMEALVQFAVFDANFEGKDPYKQIITMLLETAVHFEEGAAKYGPNNWQKGIPVHCYIDSAVRHYLKFRRGDQDEPHHRAVCWNLICAIWTCNHMPELNTYARGGRS